ncbi:MAG: hypothetical protein HY302_08235 [Opitutae bacterium]|nr:hypothetical protein [Opitutae bacterium]
MKAIVLFVGLCCAVSFAPAKPQPAKPAAPAKDTAKQASEPAAVEEPKIPGVVIPRPDGSFLGISIDGGTFKLAFYDKKKKAVDVDVTRATARWPAKYKIGDERTVLNLSGDGKSLVGGKPVRPPYVFKLWLTLLKGEGDDAKAVENYTVDFRA